MGLPLEGIALVAGVDALIDMGRTAINVTGTAVAATLTARKEGEFDMAIFSRDKTNQEVVVDA
jgi:Na+/H+-dicarboxylate symporter